MIPILNYETACKIMDNVYWGDSIDVESMNGAEATRLIAEKGWKLAGPLRSDCEYVFRWNKAGTYLVAIRVTMHPKTAANIAKGSRRYGSLAIANEMY